MTERKVLIVRVKGGMQMVQGVTNYIIEGLVRGVLVLPDEVVSYTVEELPVLYEAPSSFTKTLAEAGLFDAGKYIGEPLTEAPASVIPAVAVAPLVSDEEVKMPPASDKAAEILGELMYPKKEEAPDTDSETVPGNFKPTGANTAIKRETYARLARYKDRTGLRWAQRVSDATGGRVSPDVIRFGLLEARDIGVDRWKLIGKALDKLEEEMEK